MAIAPPDTHAPVIRRLAPLALILLSVGLSLSMAAPFVVLFLDTAVRASPLEVTIFLVAAPVSLLTFSTVLGRWSDRRPIRRPLLVVTAAAGTGASVCLAFVRSYPGVLALTVTLTALAGSVLPQTFAYARETLHGVARGAMSMSALRTLFSLAWVAGPPAAAFLLDSGGFRAVYLGFRWTYVAGTILCGIGLMLLWAIRHRRSDE